MPRNLLGAGYNGGQLGMVDTAGPWDPRKAMKRVTFSVVNGCDDEKFINIMEDGLEPSLPQDPFQSLAQGDKYGGCRG